jgi:HEAT repeat protein
MASPRIVALRRFGCRVLLLAVVAGIGGCQSGPAWLPWGGPVTDHVPGITPPAERIAEIGRLGESARRADAAEKARIAGRLAEIIRQEEDPMIRAAVVRALRFCEGAETAELLDKALRDPAADVRIAACEVLGARGGEESVRMLSEALRSDLDKDVRLAAARALGETRDPAAVEALGGALADSDPAMQYRAVLSLQSVTGKKLGSDVTKWQQYVRGELPEAEQRPSLAERLIPWF